MPANPRQKQAAAESIRYIEVMPARTRQPMRQAALFLGLAFAISWMCWLPVAAGDHGIGSRSSSDGLLVLLGTFGPLVAALSVVSLTYGHPGVAHFLGQALRWRAGVQWYFFALVAPFLIRVVVLYVHVLKGGLVPEFDDPARWSAVPLTFVYVLLIGGPTGEEFGWRGFLLQRLQSRMGLLQAGLLIGLITSIWHLPLFFITGTAQSYVPFELFALRTISLSLISTWLYNGTNRSVLFVLLFHASLNTWPNTLNVLESQGALGPYISTTAIYTGWALQLFILGLLKGRGDRRGEPRTAPSAVA